MLFDIETGSWDDELLELFGVERSILPSVVPSAGVVAEAELLGADRADSRASPATSRRRCSARGASYQAR